MHCLQRQGISRFSRTGVDGAHAGAETFKIYLDVYVYLGKDIEVRRGKVTEEFPSFSRYKHPGDHLVLSYVTVSTDPAPWTCALQVKAQYI